MLRHAIGQDLFGLYAHLEIFAYQNVCIKHILILYYLRIIVPCYHCYKTNDITKVK